eukprot:2685834-Amphidinium_carterae.2
MDREVFSMMLRRCLLTEVLGDRAKVFAQNDHRTFGTSPTRTVRRLGHVSNTHVIDFLSLSGTKTVNIRLAQRNEESSLDLQLVGAATWERATLEQQLRQVAHAGVLRTKQGKLLVRCTVDQLALVRQAVNPDDLRFKNTPALVIKHKYRVANVPVSVSAQRLSEALFSGHGWSQVSARPQQPPAKGSTWTVVLGSSTSPPFDSALIEGQLCVITQVNPPQSTPSHVDPNWQRSASATSQPALQPMSSSETIQRGLESASKSLSKEVTQRLSALDEQVVTMIQTRVEEANAESSKRVAALEQQLTLSMQQTSHQISTLSSAMETKTKHIEGEMATLAHGLNTMVTETRTQFANMSTAFDGKLDSFAEKLLAQLSQAKKRDHQGMDVTHEGAGVSLLPCVERDGHLSFSCTCALFLTVYYTIEGHPLQGTLVTVCCQHCVIVRDASHMMCLCMCARDIMESSSVHGTDGASLGDSSVKGTPCNKQSVSEVLDLTVSSAACSHQSFTPRVRTPYKAVDTRRWRAQHLSPKQFGLVQGALIEHNKNAVARGRHAIFLTLNGKCEAACAQQLPPDQVLPPWKTSGHALACAVCGMAYPTFEKLKFMGSLCPRQNILGTAKRPVPVRSDLVTSEFSSELVEPRQPPCSMAKVARIGSLVGELVNELRDCSDSDLQKCPCVVQAVETLQAKLVGTRSMAHEGGFSFATLNVGGLNNKHEGLPTLNTDCIALQEVGIHKSRVPKFVRSARHQNSCLSFGSTPTTCTDTLGRAYVQKHLGLAMFARETCVISKCNKQYSCSTEDSLRISSWVVACGATVVRVHVVYLHWLQGGHWDERNVRLLEHAIERVMMNKGCGQLLLGDFQCRICDRPEISRALSLGFCTLAGCPPCCRLNAPTQTILLTVSNVLLTTF